MKKYQVGKLFLVLLIGLSLAESQSYRGPFAWRCTEKDECWREIYVPDSGQMSLEKCKLTCGSYANLVPIPKSVNLGKETKTFDPLELVYEVKNCTPSVCTLLEEAVEIMKATLLTYKPQFTNIIDPLESDDVFDIEINTLKIEITVPGEEEYLTIKTDESYDLVITTVGNVTTASITASTFFGARHGLETLSQLVDFEVETNMLQIIANATIQDAPVFPYRGLSVDTSRNFITVDQLKKVLSAMGYNKLNTLHWHITDTNSFPVYIRTLPKMTQYGAYALNQIYSLEDVKDLVQHARIHGVRIVPEVDAPAHAGHGWEWGETSGLGKLIACLGKMPFTDYCWQAPCGQLNIANPNIYFVLEQIYKEFIDLFAPLEFFHFGGDEIFMSCWNSTSEIVEWMVSNNYGLDAAAYYKQWAIYQEKAYQLLSQSNNGVDIPGILWTSDLTKGDNADRYVNKTKFVIQITGNSSDPLITELLTKGYKVLFSNKDALYLDCGTSEFKGKGPDWCSPYKGWQDIYDHDIYAIAEKMTNSTMYNNQILGGVVLMWTEKVDDVSLEAKLWPRGSAHAERLWSNPTFDYARAEYRILEQRHRLFLRGINAERLQPEWCRQNQGQCRNPNLPAPTYDNDAASADQEI